MSKNANKMLEYLIKFWELKSETALAEGKENIDLTNEEGLEVLATIESKIKGISC